RIAVNLAGRGNENWSAHFAGQVERVECALHTSANGPHRISLVMNRRGRTGQVVDLVDLEAEAVAHVIPHHLEGVVIEQVADVLPAPGEEAVQADDLVAGREQPLAEVRANEAGAASDEDALTHYAPLRGHCWRDRRGH